jgi:hypothetical protein
VRKNGPASIAAANSIPHILGNPALFRSPCGREEGQPLAANTGICNVKLLQGRVNSNPPAICAAISPLSLEISDYSLPLRGGKDLPGFC